MCLVCSDGDNLVLCDTAVKLDKVQLCSGVRSVALQCVALCCLALLRMAVC